VPRQEPLVEFQDPLTVFLELCDALTATQEELSAMASELEPSQDAEGGPEDIPPSYRVYDTRTTIECVLEDHLRPALCALRRCSPPPSFVETFHRLTQRLSAACEGLDSVSQSLPQSPSEHLDDDFPKEEPPAPGTVIACVLHDRLRPAVASLLEAQAAFPPARSKPPVGLRKRHLQRQAPPARKTPIGLPR
jgi:hypothetical protein